MKNDIEFVFVDESDENSSYDVLEFFPNDVRKNIRRIKVENAGLSASRNLGVKESHGRWILFVWASGHFLPSSFVHLAKELKSVPEDYDLVFFEVDYKDAILLDHYSKSVWSFAHQLKQFVREKQLFGFNIPENVFINRRVFVEKNIWFNERIAFFGEDRYFAKQLKSRNLKSTVLKTKVYLTKSYYTFRRIFFRKYRSYGRTCLPYIKETYDKKFAVQVLFSVAFALSIPLSLIAPHFLLITASGLLASAYKGLNYIKEGIKILGRRFPARSIPILLVFESLTMVSFSIGFFESLLRK